jgi:hypothetical protein
MQHEIRCHDNSGYMYSKTNTGTSKKTADMLIERILTNNQNYYCDISMEGDTKVYSIGGIL